MKLQIYLRFVIIFWQPTKEMGLKIMKNTGGPSDRANIFLQNNAF